MAKRSIPSNNGSTPVGRLAFVCLALVVIAGGLWMAWTPGEKPGEPQPTPVPEQAKDGPKSPVNEPNTGSPEHRDTDFEQLADLESMQTVLTGRLKKLGEKYSGSQRLEAAQSAPFATPSFTAVALNANQLKTIFESTEGDSTLLARRWEPDETNNSSPQTIDLVSFLASLLEPIGGNSDAANLRSKFKIFQIVRDNQTFQTGVLASFFAVTNKGASGEFNATLDVRWVDDKETSYPRITSIVITGYETVNYQGPLSVGFQDMTANLLNNRPALLEQLGQGADQWTARIADHGIFGYNGICVGDVNGDQLDDVYLCQPFGLPNRLLIQQPDGTTQDASAEWGVDLSDHTRSALLIDLDNDAKQDLVVGAANGLLIYRNEGSRFVLMSEFPDIQDPYSICSADYDQDGDLDFYVCGYYDKFAEGRRFPFAFPMHDANSGGPNTLLRNEGDFQWTDVTKQVGLDVDNQKYTYAAGWQDFDNDGDQDLYVANDYGRNCFYVYEDGKFTNRASELQVEDQSFGMSVDWADIDHDGRMDLYVSNMYSTAGNRVSFQDNYLSERPELQNRMQYMARGNSLFLGKPDGFEDAGGAANVFMGRWAWGSKFVDMNNDGWDDIVVPNGFLTRQIADDL
ncbi:MAG: VCBS repeat-containing protein [Planctomycetota bacterium]|nr:VCBS repeat-containing protein [Planctomycetota bacterium]